MRDLVNLVGKYKHQVSQEKLDEMMITHLYNYINDRPNDATLGGDLRKDVLELHQLFLKVKEIRDKTIILD